MNKSWWRWCLALLTTMPGHVSVNHRFILKMEQIAIIDQLGPLVFFRFHKNAKRILCPDYICPTNSEYIDITIGICGSEGFWMHRDTRSLGFTACSHRFLYHQGLLEQPLSCPQVNKLGWRDMQMQKGYYIQILFVQQILDWAILDASRSTIAFL